MQRTLSLSEVRQQYLLGKIDKREFEGLIFQYIMDSFGRFRHLESNREKWNDFISWFYPRLSRTVNNYRETGASFETYILNIVQWAYKEYRSKEADHHVTEYACWKARAEELVVENPEADYVAVQPAPCSQPEVSLPEFYSNRQILVLLLKSYYFVSDNFIGMAAEKLGMEKQELYRLVDELKSMRLHREHQILILKERIHCQYYRCLSFEKRLRSAVPGSAYYEKVKRRFSRAKQCLETAKKRLTGIRMEATNRQIAAVLKIPKGTVDSTLYAVRTKSKIIGFSVNEDRYSRN